MGGGGGMSFEQQKWLMEQSRASAPPTPIDMRVIMARIARRKAALAAGGYGGTILTGKQATTATKTAVTPRVPSASRMRERTLLSTVPTAKLGGAAR